MAGPPTEQAIDDGTAPYVGFGGTVARSMVDSESWWPERGSPPVGAPNVVVILVDDLGYSDLGCFGSEIDTPNLDGIARGGLRYTNFHVNPMCSPTRASLLTGLNAHAAGIGNVAHADPGFPGYAMELAANAATLPEILRDHGYATCMVGKWHLTKDSHTSDAGPRDSWPCQRGFDRFYGFLDGFTNLHHPHRLVEDNHAVEIDRYPDGYYFTDDITDRAIGMVKAVKASNPATPFFLYFAHGAIHAPLHAKVDDIAKYEDRYHSGWDVIRAERFARQQELGLVAPGTELPRRNSEPGNDVAAWDDLSPEDCALYARYMAAYAAMVDSVDQNVGRLLAALRDMGELDNTIIVFTSDNGASREGEAKGTTGYFVSLVGETDTDADRARIDQVGGPRTISHYPRGWAMACNTPFRLYKVNTHSGGIRVPLLVSWPERLRHAGDRGQYAHVSDLTPTLLDAIGIGQPAERAGRALKPMTGVSFAPSFDDAVAPTLHTEQVYELGGHRGFYRDGWEVVTLHSGGSFDDDEWELYDLGADATELHNLAAARPELVEELAAAWDEAAWENQVFPVDEFGARYGLRPPWVSVLSEPVTILPGTPTLERWRSQCLIGGYGFEVTVAFSFTCEEGDKGADVDVDVEGAGDGDAGVLVAHGDQGGGYLLWIEAGALWFAHNDGFGAMRELTPVPLTTGSHVATLTATRRRGAWSIALALDGVEASVGDGFPVLFPMAPFEGIDIGIDRRSPVSWDLYESYGPFPYAGAITSVRYQQLERPEPTGSASPAPPDGPPRFE